MRNFLGRLRRSGSRSLVEQLATLTSVGDGSTLTLDFTTGVLDPRLTFTRSTTGTYINSIGYVATASTNVARFDYDPTTLAPRGLLIEGSANNLCLRSEDFGNAVWQTDNSGATNPVVSTVSQTAPNGASSVNRVTLNKTGGTFSRLYQAITGTAGQTYTPSVWMKANTANGGAATQNVGLRIGGSTGVNCVVTTTWQRFTHPAFAITGTDANFQLLLWDNIPANDETADVLVWGAQVETGSGASSYIPTGASQGSRAADFAVINDISALAYSTTNGTLFYAGRFTKINSLSYPTRVGFQTAGGANPAFEFFTNGTNAFTAARSASANPEVTTSISLNTDLKWAAAFDAALATGEVRASLNGASVITSSASSLTNTYTPTIFAIGRVGYELYFPFGTIRQVKYWPATLPDSQLQALST